VTKLLGIDVQLKEEDGEVLAEVGDRRNALSRATPRVLPWLIEDYPADKLPEALGCTCSNPKLNARWVAHLRTAG
jgi:Arc/MetJ family transcription regulator